MDLRHEKRHHKVFPEHVAARRAETERVRRAAVEAAREKRRRDRLAT